MIEAHLVWHSRRTRSSTPASWGGIARFETPLLLSRSMSELYQGLRDRIPLITGAPSWFIYAVELTPRQAHRLTYLDLTLVECPEEDAVIFREQYKELRRALFKFRSIEKHMPACTVSSLDIYNFITE